MLVRAVPLVLLLALLPVATLAEEERGSNPDPVAELGALERAFQKVAEGVSASVVNIRVRRSYVATIPGGEAAAGQARIEQSVTINGSGTIIRADGAILTNEHVVQGATEIDVVLHDGRSLPGTVIAADARSDLAILRIDADGLLPAKLCDWQSVAQGQWCIAFGNPFGLGSDGKPSVSVGVISNLGRRLPGLGEVDDRLYADMIQTTAAIHPGNSGGSLFNIRGELIGVVTAMRARSVDDQGTGFAIPLNPAKRRAIQRLVEGRPVEYGYLGLTVRALEAAERRAAGLESVGGVLVEQVEPEGPAATGGVQIGDVLTHYDSRPVEAPLHLADWVGQTPVGEQVELSLRRGEKSSVIRVAVEARQLSRVSWLRSGTIIWRGMRLADLTADSHQHVKAEAGNAGVVVIEVVRGSPADQAHIQIGDVVERVEDAAVAEVWTFMRTVRGKDGNVQLRLHERGAVTIPPPCSGRAPYRP